MAGKKKMTSCQQKASHRKAQAKYVAKDPKAQTARVKKSQQKTGSGKGGSTSKKAGSQSKGAGKHGSTQGRPRKAC